MTTMIIFLLIENYMSRYQDTAFQEIKSPRVSDMSKYPQFASYAPHTLYCAFNPFHTKAQ